jgi:hypothetical protein
LGISDRTGAYVVVHSPKAIALEPAQMYPYFAPQLRLFAFRKYGVQYDISPAICQSLF